MTEPEQWATDNRGRYIPPADWHRMEGPTLGDLLAQALATRQDAPVTENSHEEQ